MVTPTSAWTMQGAPMGWSNTPALFSNRIMTKIVKPSNLYAKQRNGAVMSLDDILLYTTCFKELYLAYERLLKQAIGKRMRVNVKKCTFVKRNIEWCARTIENSKWNFLDKYYDKLLKAPRPKYASELAQMLYLVDWISPSIHRLTEKRDKFKEIVDLQG